MKRKPMLRREFLRLTVGGGGLAATARIDLPDGLLRAGGNKLEVRVANDGWFTWDALDLTAK